MKLILVIDGDSADELCAVGPEDLMHLLNKNLYIKKKDIVKIFFEEITRGENIINIQDTLDGKDYSVYTHPDNYERWANAK